jgi:RNA polymerase sigma factor (sigma-70 family)
MIATPLAAQSDERLVARFRAGDDAAFTVVHDRYRTPLVEFARRMLRNTGHDADDVVQDAMIRAYRSLRATDRPMALRPWLYMIVRNRALDDLRAPRRADAFDDEARIAVVPDADPAHRIAERDELRHLVAEIGRLPERQRLALVLREFDGRTHAETARALHTTVPATKSLLIRARANLGAGLVGAGVDAA